MLAGDRDCRTSPRTTCAGRTVRRCVGRARASRHAHATARALRREGLEKIKEALGHAPGTALAETTYIDPAAQMAVALPWGAGLEQLTEGKKERRRAAPRARRSTAATAGLKRSRGNMLLNAAPSRSANS